MDINTIKSCYSSPGLRSITELCGSIKQFINSGELDYHNADEVKLSDDLINTIDIAKKYNVTNISQNDFENLLNDLYDSKKISSQEKTALASYPIDTNQEFDLYKLNKKQLETALDNGDEKTAQVAFKMYGLLEQLTFFA